uniref:Putative secreted protein n=1 Tax=Panstrongylus lignarius TaxID=156445 RepID=A0A224Y5X3_9HEMI
MLKAFYQVLCLFNTSTRAFNIEGLISFNVSANIVFVGISIFSESNLVAARVGISSFPKRYDDLYTSSWFCGAG